MTCAAAAAAIELAQTSATAAVPACWAQTAVAAASGGAVPAGVATLITSVIRSLLLTRLKLASLAILAMAALLSAGIVTATAARHDSPKPPLPALAGTATADEPKPAEPTQSQPGTLTIEARDLVTDAPMADVRLEFSTGSGLAKIPAKTDASGAAQFSHPAEGRYFFVSASREGFVPQAIRWDYASSAPTPPDRLLFQMEKATTIAGRVVDQDQKPVAGATVVVDVLKGYPRSRQWVNFKYESTKTNADGVWSFSSAPAKPDSVELAAYHHLCLSDHPNYYLQEFKPLAALRDGTATLRLRRGTTVEGTIVGPDGKPVAGAEVIFGDAGRVVNTIPPLKTDAQGRFSLGIAPGVVSKLIARHAGFGPALESIRVGNEPQHITLRLPPAPR